VKVLWHSNGPHAPTGYGRQTAMFAQMLAQDHEVWISANYGLEAAPLVWNGIPVLPGLGQTHGNEALPGHVNAMFNGRDDGLVWTLYDTPVFDPDVFQRFNAACWTPIDHCPPPPPVISFFRASQAIPVAMSRYGQGELGEFDPLYVPHGVDVDVFKPTASDVRQQMDLPDDAFLIGMVAANKGRPSRKCFQQAFEAFRIFRRTHEDAHLYLHTTLSASYSAGEDLPTLLASLEIPDDAVKYPNQYSMMFAPLDEAKMAQIYSACNVLLNCSMGEGFGVPIIEAAACGTPAIVTDFSAMPEVAGPGWRVSGRPHWTGQCSWMSVPDVGEMVGALEEAHDQSEERRSSLSRECRAHALGYSARSVYDEHMVPALDEIQERIGMRQPVRVAA